MGGIRGGHHRLGVRAIHKEAHSQCCLSSVLLLTIEWKIGIVASYVISRRRADLVHEVFLANY